MEKSDVNRWLGKSADYVLSQSFHEIRNPVVRMAGYLSVLKSADLTEEQTRHVIDDALRCALSVNDIVDSVYQYINARREDQ